MFINTNVVHKIEGLEADTSFYCWNIGLPDATDYVNYKYVNQIINTLDKHPYMKINGVNVEEKILIEKIKCRRII